MEGERLYWRSGEMKLRLCKLSDVCVCVCNTHTH